jgi:glycosyltransferase involved in cell wall biosynthesis
VRKGANLVFVTRKFPPSVGGMETLAASVWHSLQLVAPDSRKLSHGGPNRALVWWVPLCLLRLTWLCLRGRVSHVLCGDALMNAVCAPVLRLFGIRRSTMVMGLDITFELGLYRRLVHPRLRSAEHVIAISAATAAEAQAVGVPSERLSVLRLGVAEPEHPADPVAARTAVLERLRLPADTLLLLTLGRLVPRKGVRWFVDAVLPSLPAHVHYLAAGSGPDETAIRSAAAGHGVADRVHLLGAVSDDLREELMTGCDVFVQPNIVVPDDMEGFGLVTVEAGMRDTLVVAAALQGIKDAVVPDVTGILVAPEEPTAWRTVLADLDERRADIPALAARYGAATREIYSEKAMGEALGRLLAGHTPGRAG